MSTTAIRLMALRVFYERYRILIACNYNLLIAVYHKLDAFSLNKRDEFFFQVFKLLENAHTLDERLWSLSFSLLTSVFGRWNLVDISTTTFDVCLTQHAFYFHSQLNRKY